MSPLDKRKSALCLKCLRCCQLVAVRASFAFSDADAVRFYNLRGAAVCEDERGMAVVVFKQQCQHLTSKGCQIYDKRPPACRAYDGRQDPVLQGVCLWHGITEEEEDRDVLLKLSEKVLGFAPTLTRLVDIN